MDGKPGWLVSQLRDRGICEDCCERRGETYWQHADGPLICWECCEKRRAAAVR